MNRKFGAAAAAIALSAGLVACSNDEGDVKEVEATETDTATVTSATAESETAASEADAAAADGETTEITTQDGEKVVVPAAAANAPEELGLGNWGDPFNVETTEDGATLIEYDAEKNIVYSEETGAVPLVGEIAKTWKKDGGLKNEIGLPLKAEDKRSDDNGWIQEFQNGTIEWLEENGEFGAKIS
ncbi:hypothetical protein QYQ98_09430 [Corynebacterium sp. P3-F1]|uniref:LGFP repeat-containing protein n=1 Tax=Corynebacterium sp. P3-F1 TaxID=3059080 RepID=UPI00265D4036|nr:hypothetical protein [Corynebacterium sp. P3-F1]WKK61223.1 hypothetical protein QYQ98_09430 [Corynebacterium sp. P3-F1]